MKKILILPVLLLLPALLALGLARPGAAVPASGGPDAVAERDGRPVIVEVEGTRSDGFTLHYADGSTLSPPTDSEAAAECSEYDTFAARLRCRVEVRTWYRDLGDLQRSLAHVRAHG